MTHTSARTPMEVRVASPGDEPAIEHLLRRASRPPIHNWWWEDHLGQEVFLLAELRRRPVGALLAWPDAGPFAWVRLAVLSHEVDVQLWLDHCLPPLVRALRPLGARRLGWIDLGGWAGPAAPAHGFHQQTRLITLVKTDHRLQQVRLPGVRVRRGTSQDVEAIARVDRAAFTLPWWLSPQTLDRLRRESDCFLIAERSGRCVGYIEAQRARYGAHIGRLAVAPHAQKRGVGHLLLNEAALFLWDQGIEQITLNTQEENWTSQRLYLRVGFRPFGERIVVWERAL
jgi:ribosomal protein S18 acetylase RimI-like enzyme